MHTASVVLILLEWFLLLVDSFNIDCHGSGTTQRLVKDGKCWLMLHSQWPCRPGEETQHAEEWLFAVGMHQFLILSR